MIIVEDASRLRCVTQTDHAQLSAELLGLWTLNGLPKHPRRKDLLFAVREHDNGWREADAAPRVDPESGRPFDYRNLPSEFRLDLWKRGVERLITSHPYAALLIAAHCLNLHQSRRNEHGWQDFLSQTVVLQEELLESAGLSQEELEEDYAWMELADTISLVVCDAWNGRTEQHGSVFGSKDGALEIEPFSLAGTTSFKVACRHVPMKPYSSDSAFAAALAEAKWEKLRLQVRPQRPQC